MDSKTNQVSRLCVIGVDGNVVLKDFIRAHVELLRGDKVCLDHWYPDYTHEGKTVRAFYRSRPWVSKLKSLLPHVLYQRWVASSSASFSAIHDALEHFFGVWMVDCILAEFGPAGAEIAPHARRLGLPLIVHFHGHDAHRSSTVFPLLGKYAEMFMIARSVISVSAFMTARLIELGCPEEKIITNPYGPRDHYFDICPDYRPTILALGRFTDIKANFLTLMAFRQVVEACPEARLVMGGDGELLETCRCLAEVWGLGGKVSFPGAVAHNGNRRLFEESCCFVQHSVTPSYGDAEGTPVVILEAQAAGLPVVSTRHAGITDAVVDGETGFLVNERDVGAMASAMLRLVSDQALCRKMGNNAREHIRRNYSMTRHIGRLQEVIDLARASP